MRLVFDASGALTQFYAVTPSVAAPSAPLVTIDVEYPTYFVAGVQRAVNANRVTYSAGHVCLDGSPYTPPAVRTPVSYSVALSAIAGATTIAQLKDILSRVCDEFLGLGALEL